MPSARVLPRLGGVNDHAPTAGLDVLIVGGGPAGLSAAMWLARYRRRVLVVDAGTSRNERAVAVHGYPGVPDIAPAELHAVLLKQAEDAGATVVRDVVTSIHGRKDAFHAETAGSGTIGARRILLATGHHDVLPEVPGLDEAYGITVHHCPDCDGPSSAGQRVGVLGHDLHAAALALFLLTWTPHVILLTNGREPRLDAETLRILDARGVHVRTDAIERLDQTGGFVRRAVFRTGAALPLERVFFFSSPPSPPALGIELGCEAVDGRFLTDEGQQTTVAGVYAAGDITGHPHLSISAAAEGVAAALAIHRSLLPEEFKLGS